MAPSASENADSPSLDILIRGEGGRDSRISFGPVEALGQEIGSRDTVLVTDPLISKLHGSRLPKLPLALVPAGEAAKSLTVLEQLYARFLELGLGRDASVLAVGGGTVSDLAGFAASTWLRGVDFGFAPTTLLAMVDASVGGKNGVDFRGVKNLIGSFSQPRFVRIDVSFLDSLSDREFASGMGEVIKHAVIEGGKYLNLVEASAPGSQGKARPDRGSLEALVAGSVKIKAAVVAEDEHETGRRRVLNLGHTAGHGIEVATGLPHGHAVSAGLATACRLAEKKGLFAEADIKRILAISAGWGLPTSIAEAARLAGIDDSGSFREAVAKAALSDKKRVGGDILMALPRAFGDVIIQPVPVAELQSFIMEAA